jgi:hypothetical protein
MPSTKSYSYVVIEDLTIGGCKNKYLLFGLFLLFKVSLHSKILNYQYQNFESYLK